jgi:bifunctional DNase/RNase
MSPNRLAMAWKASRSSPGDLARSSLTYRSERLAFATASRRASVSALLLPPRHAERGGYYGPKRVGIIGTWPSWPRQPWERTPMPVQMQLSRIIISEINDQQVIYLKEVEGERYFPILIGIYEATSIDRRVKRIKSQRPLTHDLLVNSIEALGGELDSVVINELRDHTYFAQLRVKVNGEIVEIDSRPSDAIAVAASFNPILPIYVAEEVLEDASSS